MRKKMNCTKSFEDAAPQQSIPSTPFESLLTLQEASQIIPAVNGRRSTSSTIWRWCRKGIRGVYLEHVYVGKAILTSEAALYKFFIELSKSGAAAPRPECCGCVVLPISRVIDVGYCRPA
jgi:hypothetical protein